LKAGSALIGHTGFVGSNLMAQREFDATFNSRNIHAIDGRSFDHVICAGVTAVKWWANQNPDEDLARIQSLMSHLNTVECRRFVLISTVDVYADSRRVDEDTPLQPGSLHAYGRNRALFEKYVADRFGEALILRLPALFGIGLKKNAIYDLRHDNRLSFIHPNSEFQWYPLGRLSADILRAETAALSLVNLSAEPVSMAAIVERFFPGKVLGGDVAAPSFYDMHSRHATLLGGQGHYVVTAEHMMADLAHFLRTWGTA
jgi:hypothetical protein